LLSSSALTPGEVIRGFEDCTSSPGAPSLDVEDPLQEQPASAAASVKARYLAMEDPCRVAGSRSNPDPTDNLQQHGRQRGTLAGHGGVVMPRWIEVMLCTPEEPLTRLARYTQANGLLYLALGLSMYAWPGMLCLLGADPLKGQEPALCRTIGLAIAIIGWFYVIGARTNRDSFGLATFADRILVPFFLLPLVFTGQIDPMIVLPIAILDPILGIGAFLIWRKSSKGQGPARSDVG
jgi:hypothetical protein